MPNSELPIESDWLESLQQQFVERYHRAPTVASWAPGRVNLIGEHTDYNGGYVLPAALELGTLLLAAPRDDECVRVHSLTLNATAEFDAAFPEREEESAWLDYARGVASELNALDLPVIGADVLVDSNLPIGSGLSSSASFEMAILGMFETLGGFELSLDNAALLGQRVENRFLGLSSGIMDQYAVRGGRQGHALLLDCRSLECTPVPADLPGHVFVVADTASPRRLSGSEYNRRVAECAEALEGLRTYSGVGCSQLRDFSLDALNSARGTISEIAWRRARHVLSEIARTIEACDALRAGDAALLGALMDASHASLRDDYEVSSDSLDAMVSALRTQPGCLGARLTGAGFGGCTVSLFEAGHVTEGIMPALNYQTHTDLAGTAFVLRPAAGARAWQLELPVD